MPQGTQTSSSAYTLRTTGIERHPHQFIVEFTDRTVPPYNIPSPGVSRVANLQLIFFL